MKGVILAAGKGTRLKPLTDDKPKPMVTVNGQPLIEYALEYSESMQVTELHIVVGYMRDQIINEYGNSYHGIPINYHIQETQDGLAHALRQVNGDFEDHFLLLLADVIYENFPENKISTNKTTLVTETVPYENAHEYGVCETNEFGEVTNLVEKPDVPPTNQILAGSYVLPPEIFQYCKSVRTSDRGEYELTDAINELLSRDKITAELVEVEGWRVDVARPENIWEVEQKHKKPLTAIAD